MKKALRVFVVGLLTVNVFILLGCGSNNTDDGTVKGLPQSAPVTDEQKAAAAAASQNDPKAAGDAPRPDGK